MISCSCRYQSLKVPSKELKTDKYRGEDPDLPPPTPGYAGTDSSDDSDDGGPDGGPQQPEERLQDYPLPKVFKLFQEFHRYPHLDLDKLGIGENREVENVYIIFIEHI